MHTGTLISDLLEAAATAANRAALTEHDTSVPCPDNLEEESEMERARR